MRKRVTKQGLTVQATAGTHVVMLGINMAQADCAGLLGFAIHRRDHTEDEAYWLHGLKSFAETDPGFGPGASYSTREHPIQGFAWSDFSAKPGHAYTYRVVALYGTPTDLEERKSCSVTIETEDPEGGEHDVYFNRGAAASQEYARRFQNVRPDEQNPDDPRWAWLSRGAVEAVLAFVERATGPGWGLRVAAYEFRLDSLAQALRKAQAQCGDVQVLYDGCDHPPEKDGSVFPRDENRETAKTAKIKGLCRERRTRDDVKSPPIPHNKFIVLLRDGQAQAVLTGSTNFSRGGAYGQSNVVHVVEDAAVASRYLAYWDELAANPDWHALKTTLSAQNKIPAGKPAKGTRVLFSPQSDLSALDFYARLASEAREGLFMTFAFGINKRFMGAYRNGQAKLRYALLDKLLGPGVRKENREAAIAEMTALRRKRENRFAVGNRIVTNAFDRWLSEKLTGLNSHVQYIHTKFMLIDPLGNDPIVVTGSANFSDASTDENDENMLIIRGNKRVADIYLSEYMRLWNHYAFREFLASEDASKEPELQHLKTDDRWWRRYFGDTAHARQRLYFSGTQQA